MSEVIRVALCNGFALGVGILIILWVSQMGFFDERGNQMMIKCHLGITPSKDCYEVCIQSRRCEALKMWENRADRMTIEALTELDNNSTELNNKNVELVRKEDVIKMIQEINISSGMTKARLLIKAQNLPPVHEPRLAQKIWTIVRKINDSDGLQHEVVYYNDLKDVMYEVMGWMI